MINGLENPKVACKESTGTGKLVADRPASNPEPVTLVASTKQGKFPSVEINLLEEEEEWPDVVGWIDPEGVGVPQMLYDRETEERMAREGKTEYPGNVVWTTNPAGFGTFDLYGGKVWPKEDISISRFTVEQGDEKEKRKVKVMEKQQRKPEKALNVIMRASAVEQARLKKEERNKRKKKCEFSSVSSKPAPCAVHWTGAGRGTFTGRKVSDVNMCLNVLPTQNRDSRVGDLKEKAGGGQRKMFGDSRQLEAGGGETNNDFEENDAENSGLRAAPFCVVGGDVGTEAPQKKKKGVATFGVALPSKKDPGRERTLKRDKRIL